MKALRMIAVLLCALFSFEDIYIIYTVFKFILPVVINTLRQGGNFFAVFSLESSVLLGFCVLTALSGLAFRVVFLIFSFQKNFSVKKSVISPIWFFTNILLHQLVPLQFMIQTETDTFWTNYIGWNYLEDITWQNTLRNIILTFIFVVLLLTALQVKKEKTENPA